jgi:hypothetical protein
MAKAKKVKPKEPVIRPASKKSTAKTTEDPEGGIGSRPDDRKPPKKDE